MKKMQRRKTMRIQKKRNYSLLQFVSLIVIVSILVGCDGLSKAELATVDYAPISRDEWPVSSPEEQGLDPELVAELYYNGVI
jgi:hypothetical protein